MAERLVLNASSHGIEAAVRDPNDVEWVGDTGGMIEAWRQPGAQRLGQIRRNHLDAGEPGGVGVRGPFPQVNGCVALDHVDHLVAFQVDEAGHLVAFQVDEADHLVAFQVDEAGRVDRVVMSVRAQKRRLIHPQLAHPTDPGRVVDERSAVLNNGVHDRLPTHTELVCDLRHRSRQLTNPAARLSTGASSENDLGIEELERFGPRLGRTQQLPTPPSSADSTGGCDRSAMMAG